MPYRIVFLAAALLCFSLPCSSADATERVTFQNRLGVDATVTFAGPAGGEAARIHGNVPDGGTFSVDAETLRGCDTLIVQPYFDSSFRFYLPFTLAEARSVVYANLSPAGETRRLAPVLTALVGDNRISVPAGFPLRRLAVLMAQGMTEKTAEQWLVALRLPGEQPGRYAVAIGESTWGYGEGELAFAASSSGEKELSEAWLATAWAPKALRPILEDMRASGLTPVLLTEEGKSAKAFGPEGLKLDPKAGIAGGNSDKAWDEALRLVAGVMESTPVTATLHLAGPGLRYALSLDSGSRRFALHIVRE